MRRLTLALMLAAAGCRQGPVSGVELSPLELSTQPLSFSDTFVGFTDQRTLTLTAPGKSTREVRLTITGPFDAPTSVQLPGSESTEVTLSFRPTAEGPAEGTLELVDVALQQTFSLALTGRGLAIPDCRASSPCVTSRFEVSARGCVETPVPNDTPCTSPLSCFSRASCVAGECRGTTVTCDDGDPCTLDVCSDLGCGQVDGTPSCPGSSNPCLVPTCSRDTGCGLAEVPDGTACGERSCTTALICVSGACVQRTPPKSQACADVLVGVPAGRGFVDGRSDDARFTGVQSIAAQGEDVLVIDDARVRLVRRGNVTTIAGRSPSAGLIDGIGTNASLGLRASLAPTTTPGLFFLGESSTIRLVSSRGAITTLAGRADAGGALDGIGAAARLSLSSPLMPGGAGARWVQVPRDTTALSPLLVREVSSTGLVRTLQSFDLTQLPTIDAGQNERWFVYSSGVAPIEPLTAWVSLNDPSRMSYSYRLTWTDGGVTVTPASELMRWSSTSGAVTHDSCRVRFEFDAGPVVAAAPACLSPVTFDGDRTVFAGGGQSVFAFTTDGGLSVIAGPVPDRRIVDGDRDAGRTASPRSLSAAPDGVFFLDSTSSLPRARLLRLGANDRASLETIDAGIGFQTSLAFHQGQLWLTRDDNVGLVTVLEPSGALVRRFTHSALNLGQVHSNGSVLRAAAGWFHELSTDDGGVRRIPGLTNTFASAPAPGGVWYLFASRDPNDGGFATEPRQLFRVEADDSFMPVAGDVTKATDSDGPALTAGITTLRSLTVSPDGTVSFLGAKNQLRQLRNGQVTTLMTFSDAPEDVLALSDGSLIVAVDAALLRVFP